jgi:nitroimidazol reductase NimA-like FMN-containing flavoprotein (pyridoxamine 5'-phosphate oxidase superfamily)
MDRPPPRMRTLSTADALSLLGSVSLGRIAFTQRAIPAIWPVNHALDGADVIIRGSAGAAILSTRGQVVAYQVDTLTPGTEVGWWVVVTGRAAVLDDPGEVARHQRMVQHGLHQGKDYIVRLHTDVITGFVMVEAATT